MHALGARRSIAWLPSGAAERLAAAKQAPAEKKSRCAPREWFSASALLAAFADYFGLALITPALPFYLSELGMPTDRVAVWNGAITSAQFIAVVIGNTVWGRVSDRLGSQRALQWAMGGDAAFFALSALAPFGIADPTVGGVVLVAVRLCVGFFTPLVSCILYIFDRARSPTDVMRGLGHYTYAIMGAYALGGVLVGVGYDAMGWVGLNLTATGFAAFAFLYVTFLSAPARDQGKKPRPEGLARALKTRAFATHAYTAFLCGWMMNALILVSTLLLKDTFGLTSQQVGFVQLGLPAVMLPLTLLMPRATARHGLHCVINGGAFWSLAASTALALPAVHGEHVAPLLVGYVSCLIGLIAQMVPNQARGKIIAERYAKNATGAVTAVGRNFFALGQALSPIVSAALLQVHPSAPYALLGALQLGALVLYAATGTPLFHDPPIVASA